MKEALQIVKNELEFSAKSHMNASVQFKSQLETPTHEFLTTQSGMRKNFHGIVDKQLKAKQASFESVNKSRERYISKCKEVNHLMHQKPGLPPKEMDKLKAKLEKSQLQAKQYDVEYLMQVDHHNAMRQKWIEDFTITCRECQKLEQDRFEFLQTRLWTYSNILSAICVSNDEGYERIRISLESCDWSKDLEVLVESRATGTTPPQPVQYTNFYTGTPLRPLDALPYNNQSINSNIQSISEYRPSISVMQVATATDDQNTAPVKRSSLAEWAASTITGILGIKSQEGSEESAEVKLNITESVDQFVDESYGPDAESLQENSEDIYYYDPFDVSPNVPILFHVIVTHEYVAKSFEELTISVDQILPVIGLLEEGWNEAIVNDNGQLRKGLFPSNFTRVYNGA
ncbi:hypothetical protein BDR26DRAFT_876224 [Obelidium mucronatum]|nr:hypothetical protein BDR26DRAFT_876224 [Obelidium mucronatum]